MQRFGMGYGNIHRILTESLQTSKIILSKNSIYTAVHVANVYIVNCYKLVCVLTYRQLLTGLSQSMNNRGMRTCFNNEFTVITVVSSVKNIILSRSELIVVFFDVSHLRRHEICVDVRRVAVSDHFVFNVAFYRIITFF